MIPTRIDTKRTMPIAGPTILMTESLDAWCTDCESAVLVRRGPAEELSVFDAEVEDVSLIFLLDGERTPPCETVFSISEVSAVCAGNPCPNGSDGFATDTQGTRYDVSDSGKIGSRLSEGIGRGVTASVEVDGPCNLNASER